jgi:hypothetical protein
MGESTLLNKYEMVSSYVVNLKIGGVLTAFFTPSTLDGVLELREYLIVILFTIDDRQT